MAPALLADVEAGGVIADKAYDSNALRTLIAAAGAEAVIPSNRTRKILIPHDAIAYKLRNRIERFFNKLKHFRRIATPLRPTCNPFPRLPASRQRHDMDALNVDSA
jgi:transposase